MNKVWYQTSSNLGERVLKKKKWYPAGNHVCKVLKINTAQTGHCTNTHFYIPSESLIHSCESLLWSNISTNDTGNVFPPQWLVSGPGSAQSHAAYTTHHPLQQQSDKSILKYFWSLITKRGRMVICFRFNINVKLKLKSAEEEGEYVFLFRKPI